MARRTILLPAIVALIESGAGSAQAHMTAACAEALLKHDIAVAAAMIAQHQKVDHKTRVNTRKFLDEVDRNTIKVRDECLKPRRPRERR